MISLAMTYGMNGVSNMTIFDIKFNGNPDSDGSVAGIVIEANKWSKGFQDLAKYCHLREMATMHRLGGSISKAQSLEKQADKVYSVLPDSLKW